MTEAGSPAIELARRAAAWFESVHPERKVSDVRLVVREPGRLVFRVWYRGKFPARPAPYAVVAVPDDRRCPSEVDLEEHPQYRLRGHK